MKKIEACLWFNGQAEEAANFYTTVFKNSKIGRTARYSEAGAQVSGQKAGSLMTIELDLEDFSFLGLNGGPEFKFTPALSFFVACESVEEIEEKWNKLSSGGQPRMGLDKYPWAEKYGWVADRFGVEWQLMLTSSPHKIRPAFTFVDKLFGRGEEAVNFYMSMFKTPKIEFIDRDESSKTIRHCAFTLANQGFVLMEGPGQHNWTFSMATSLMMNCADQTEIDKFWDKLSEGGQPSQCGWVTDKFGVAWQVIPVNMGQYMTDPAKAERVMKVLLTMQKIDIAKLQAAAT